jgi:hypothetical protein
MTLPGGQIQDLVLLWVVEPVVVLCFESMLVLGLVNELGPNTLPVEPVLLLPFSVDLFVVAISSEVQLP